MRNQICDPKGLHVKISTAHFSGLKYMWGNMVVYLYEWSRTVFILDSCRSPSPRLSPCVQQKPYLSDEYRVDYVQVDEKKTQALQSTKMEWSDVRQSKT